MTRTTTRSAPTDPDAQVPGHLPSELPKSATLADGEDDDTMGDLDEEAWVPGRWEPTYGDPVSAPDAARLGDGVGDDPADDLSETDDRTEGDNKGNGMPDPKDPDHMGMAQHLRDDDPTSLGSPPQEKPELSRWDEQNLRDVDWLIRETHRYLLQENPPGAGMVDPTKPPTGFYSAYDAAKDHGDVEKMQGAWYRSPGRDPGSNGDPFRGDDPATQLGQHSTRDGTRPPAVDGEEGIAARRAPPQWPLGAGDDTSTILGANVHNTTTDVGSEDGTEAEEGPEEGAGNSEDEGNGEKSE